MHATLKTHQQRSRHSAFTFLAALAAILAASSPAAAQFTPFEAAIAHFDAAVAAGVAEDAGGAVSVAVFSGDEIIWSKGWGWADIERGRPATAGTIGRSGSISKSFTAVLMMQLVERGLIGLDEPVARYLPEIAELTDPPADARPITFRMLASHTAGLEREPGLEGAASGSIYRWEEKVLASIPTTGFRTAPGTEYAYSNIGYGMLGLALSRAAGVPFMELMETLLFSPLGMEGSTFIVDSPELFRRLSVGYTRDRRTGTLSAEAATREHFGRGYKVPNGGIYTTVTDLAALAAALMGQGPVQILNEDSRREMLRPQDPAEGYGLGFTIQQADGHTLVGHGGSVAGYNANLVFDLESGLGVAMLRTTSYNPPAASLLRDLLVAEPPR
ncbi:MAG: serine hydrolase domain-containing protein [Gemmatimonadota bacterium]